MMTRKQLALAIAATLVGGILAGGSVRATELQDGVAAGDVTQRTGVLWARAGAAGRMRFELSRNPDLSKPNVFNRIVTDPMKPAKVSLFGLRPGTTYYYRATDADGNSSRGRFETAPPVCADNGVRFGVSGDWRPELAPYPSVVNVPERQLDFFVGLGDSIYAENLSDPSVPAAATLSEYRAKHSQVLSGHFGPNAWRAARGATALLATVDDHEVINDYAGGAAPASDPRFDASGAYINETQRYRDGIQAFLEYMPVRELRYGNTGDPRTAGKPKLYRVRHYGNAAMVALLDSRSFRDALLPPVGNLNDPQQVGAFLAASFDPSRTLLGAAQLADLKRDLEIAQAAGVVWKFVMLPEPVQNLGVLAASDRYEGYAAERSELLRFVDERGIDNVVFVTADIHGTLVNNLSYQHTAFAPQIPLQAWEISTGAVAFDQPFGQTVVGLAAGLGLVTPQQKAFYDSLPIAPDADAIPNDKDDFLTATVDPQLGLLGYDTLGLAGSPIDARLEAGDYVTAHQYGWSEFEIDAATKELLVTTWGIPPYSQAELAADPATVTARTPVATSRFRVQPVHTPGKLQAFKQLFCGLLVQ